MMNNMERRPFYKRAWKKVKSWFNPQTVDGRKVRSLILGTLATIAIGEVTMYRVVKQDIMAGELNMFTLDFVIIGLSVVEVLFGPFLAWFGSDNRRFLMLSWNIALAVVSLLWLAMPSSAEIIENEYCHARNPVARVLTTSPQAAVRLTMMVLSGIVFCLTRVVVWSHGIAYIDQHAPGGTSMHLGILVTFRVVALIVFNKILPFGQSMTMQVFALAGSTVGNIFQVIWFMPKMPPIEEYSESLDLPRGFIATMGRVVRNTLAMSQMAGIGLMAAALWGFAYHNDDIVQVKHHLDVSIGEGIAANLARILRYLVVVMAVVYIGVKLSPPVLPEFCGFRGIKQATFVGVLALVFYILLITLGYCDRGYVAGLERNRYVSPECNQDCRCIPRWNEFSPVCAVDQITTYVSPCHAGCSNSETFKNIRVFTNCTCAPNVGRATVGACSLEACSQAYDLHDTLFVLVVMASVLSFQAQGVVLLQAVASPDRGLALGLAGAVVASLAFGVGHLIYLGITAATCRWYEDGRCHLQSELFPTYIGSASAVLVFLSLAISVTTWVVMTIAQRKLKTREPESSRPEEIVLMDGSRRSHPI